jgi:hypothetical protein
VDLLCSVGGFGVPSGQRRPDLEDAVGMLKRMVSMAPFATGALRIQALVLLTLTLAVPAVAGADEYLRLKALVIVYPNTFAGTATFSEIENVREEVDEAVEFIWRSSKMRLHLAVDDLTIHQFVAEDQFGQSKPGHYLLPFWTAVRTDLADLGYQSGSYDVVLAFYAFESGPGRSNRYGAYAYGGKRLLDQAAFIGVPMTWRPNTFNGYVEHEFLHVLSGIFKAGGYTDFPIVHNGNFFQWVNGKDASYEKWLLGSLSDAAYFDPTLGSGTVESFKDRDGDGVPDYSPYGDELSITEETLGSSTSSADSDGDGLSDLEEATAGARRGTDPNNPDTDGDGVLDPLDLNPFGASESEAW